MGVWGTGEPQPGLTQRVDKCPGWVGDIPVGDLLLVLEQPGRDKGATISFASWVPRSRWGGVSRTRLEHHSSATKGIRVRRDGEGEWLL